MTTELQIPIEIILELISSVNKTEFEYWDEVKIIDGIKDYDSLESVVRITEYINSHLNTPLKCGSFRIMRYDKRHLRYYNLDNEVPDMVISMADQKIYNSYYIYFEYRNAHFYIEPYCSFTKYLMDEKDYTVFDLDGNNLFSTYDKCQCSEGYYSIRCFNALARMFADIDEVFESKMINIYMKELEKFNFPKEICVNSLESFIFCICVNLIDIVIQHSEEHPENQEFIGHWEYLCNLLSKENIKDLPSESKDTCVTLINIDEEFLQSFITSIFFICTVTIDIVQNDPERKENENHNFLFLIYDHICYFTPKEMIEAYH